MSFDNEKVSLGDVEELEGGGVSGRKDVYTLPRSHAYACSLGRVRARVWKTWGVHPPRGYRAATKILGCDG